MGVFQGIGHGFKGNCDDGTICLPSGNQGVPGTCGDGSECVPGVTDSGYLIYECDAGDCNDCAGACNDYFDEGAVLDDCESCSGDNTICVESENWQTGICDQDYVSYMEIQEGWCNCEYNYNNYSWKICN